MAIWSSLAPDAGKLALEEVVDFGSWITDATLADLHLARCLAIPFESVESPGANSQNRRGLAASEQTIIHGDGVFLLLNPLDCQIDSRRH
jgi:hypothetical protein